MEENKNTTPLDLFNPANYTKDQQKIIDRWRICRSCPDLKVGVCTHCGCIMKLKVKLEDSSCPIGKW